MGTILMYFVINDIYFISYLVNICCHLVVFIYINYNFVLRLFKVDGGVI